MMNKKIKVGNHTIREVQLYIYRFCESLYAFNKINAYFFIDKSLLIYFHFDNFE